MDKGMPCALSTSSSILELGKLAPKRGMLLLEGFYCQCGTREGMTSLVRPSFISIPTGTGASLNLSTQQSTVFFALHHERCGAGAMTTWSSYITSGQGGAVRVRHYHATARGDLMRGQGWWSRCGGAILYVLLVQP